MLYTKTSMCSRCDGFLERRRVNSPYEYRDLVRQIREIVKEGTFRVVRGTCTLESILTTDDLPEPLIEHVFECTTCLRRFQLAVETYHGSGGSWEVMTSPPQSLKTAVEALNECYGDFSSIGHRLVVSECADHALRERYQSSSAEI